MRPMLQGHILTFYIFQGSCSSGMLAPAQAICDRERAIHQANQRCRKESEGKALTQKTAYGWEEGVGRQEAFACTTQCCMHFVECGEEQLIWAAPLCLTVSKKTSNKSHTHKSWLDFH